MIADFLVGAIIVLCGYIGYKIGFMKSLINVISYIVSLILSFILYPVVSDLLMKTELFPYLTKLINENYVSKKISDGTEKLFGVFSEYLSENVTQTAEAVSQSIAGFIISVIAFLIITIVFKIGISLIAKCLNLATKTPVIKQFNHFGGAVFGCAAGVMLLYIAFAVIAVAEPVKADERVMEEIEKSWIAAEMYENNYLLKVIGKGELDESK